MECYGENKREMIVSKRGGLLCIYGDQGHFSEGTFELRFEGQGTEHEGIWGEDLAHLRDRKKGSVTAAEPGRGG